MFDVIACLQVKPDSMHNSLEFGRKLRDRDRVERFDPLASFSRKIPSFRRIPLNIVKDHVKHMFERVKPIVDHVKLCLELPCSDAIPSNYVWNFFAHAR
jgi:hypothetical protein